MICMYGKWYNLGYYFVIIFDFFEKELIWNDIYSCRIWHKVWSLQSYFHLLQCSQGGPLKGTRVPLGDFFRKRVPFWSPFYQKVPFSSKMYIIWGNYENHGMINWTFLIHIGCWHKKFLGKFIILFGKWKTLNYDSFERIPHFFPRLRHFGVPF